MSDILLLLGVITETGELCFNYKEGQGRRTNRPASQLCGLALMKARRPLPNQQPQFKAGLQRRSGAGGSGSSCCFSDMRLLDY